MSKVPEEVIASLRDDRPISYAKLEALRQFTKAVVSQRGWVPEQNLQAFLDAGYTRAQVLEVVLGVSLKTLSNFINHLAETPIDEQFQAFAPEETSASSH